MTRGVLFSMRDSNDITILLLQHRKNERGREAERAAFREVCGVTDAQLRALDVHADAPTTALLDGVDAIIIGGSGYSVFEETPHQDAAKAVVLEADRRGIPILGVCFGAQLLAATLGGKVVRDADNMEVGTFTIRRTDDGSVDALFADMPDKFAAQCAHQDRITEAPPNAVILAKSDKCSIQAFAIPGRDIYAVQFHPEVTKAGFLERIERDKQSSLPMPHPPGVCYALVDPYDVEETPHAFALVRRFVDRIVLHRAKTVV
jgi:GMP synthase (glutamine-hydrolysing)